VDYKVGTLVAGTVPVPVTQTAYNLDAVGNWDSKTTDAVIETRTHNAANEITAIGAQGINHDHNGNLTGDGQFSHEYDENNRLIRVTRLSDSIAVGEYVYDALGRRVIKLTDGDGDSIQTETRFYYDDARAIEDQDGIGTTLATYVFGNYVDEVLTMDRLGSRYFYHPNTLWSPHAITDATGTLAERYSYDAYGRVTVSDGLGVLVADNTWGTPHSAISNRITFTGRELDEEIGLYFYRARIYDCAKGRFLSRDPLGYVDGMNLYEYVRSNAINRVDPFGQNSTCRCGPDITQVIADHLNAFIDQDQGNLHPILLWAESPWGPRPLSNTARSNGRKIRELHSSIATCGTERCSGAVTIGDMCISGYHVDHILVMTYISESYGVQAARSAGQYNESFWMGFFTEGASFEGSEDEVSNADLNFNEVALCISTKLKHRDANNCETDHITAGEILECTQSVTSSTRQVISRKDSLTGKKDYYDCPPCNQGIVNPGNLTLPPIDL
jgi:RHS repeat-associated protein